MHEREIHREPDALPTASAELVAALQRLPRRLPFIPPVIDQHILFAARKQLATRTPRRRWWPPLRQWMPAGTMLLLAAGIAYLLVRPAATFAREDINRDGRIDILDAFELARCLREINPERGKTGDVNRDGVVDGLDVREIAARAVQLRKDSSS